MSVALWAVRMSFNLGGGTTWGGGGPLLTVLHSRGIHDLLVGVPTGFAIVLGPFEHLIGGRRSPWGR